MSLAQLSMTIEPGHDETLLMLTAAGRRPVLRARLSPAAGTPQTKKPLFVLPVPTEPG